MRNNKGFYTMHLRFILFGLALFGLLCLNMNGNAANQVPVPDAGQSRYVAWDAVTLDGSDSYDPDGNTVLFYRWRQISGPTVTINGPHTAAPEISGFVPTGEIQTCEFVLVVSDGVTTSPPDTVQIIIVPDFSGRIELILKNPPFRPDLPTIVGFNGGDCSGGGPLALEQPEQWYRQANYFSGAYDEPYTHKANMLMVFLSREAPEYNQPIQTIGFSTGGNPAVIVASYINQNYRDSRYAVNRISLLDTGCIDFQTEVNKYYANALEGEQAWVDVYRASAAHLEGTLDVAFPAAAHEIPYNWFKESAHADNWVEGNPYNSGATGGYYTSVIGPGKNLQLVQNGAWYSFECNQGHPDLFKVRDSAIYPGKLPEPVTLTGPADGADVGPEGALLTCRESENAVRYQLLFGPDLWHVDTVVSETAAPPGAVITDFPYNPTYWTIKAADQWGTTIHADPRAVYTGGPLDLPAVSILQPAAGQTVSGTVDIQAAVRDDAGIRKVKFYVDGRLEYTANNAPWSFQWDTAAHSNQRHLLRVTAYNYQGRQNSARCPVTVENMNITLQAARHVEAAWIIRMHFCELAISAANGGNAGAVEKYILYRKISGVGNYQPMLELPADAFQHGVYRYFDMEIDTKASYIYKVEARDAAGGLVAVSPTAVI
ncbi:MAG: hypothetical protein GY950_26645 [bacterium]|nr:hypothetical protein [bacterium]